jgi:uncharacterized protein
MPAWLADATGVTLAVRVTPRAPRDTVALAGDRLAVRLRAPPVEGAANAGLVAFLADWFGLPKRAVTILSGETARLKRVRIDGDPQRLAERLAAL